MWGEGRPAEETPTGVSSLGSILDRPLPRSPVLRYPGVRPTTPGLYDRRESVCANSGPLSDPPCLSLRYRANSTSYIDRAERGRDVFLMRRKARHVRHEARDMRPLSFCSSLYSLHTEERGEPWRRVARECGVNTERHVCPVSGMAYPCRDVGNLVKIRCNFQDKGRR